MKGSSRSQLPQEMIDMIIDFLYSEEDALAACSLVCRSWLPATRYHLFGHPRIVQNAKGYSPRYPEDNWRAFILFLQQPHNPFLSYIRGAFIMVATDLSPVVAALTRVSHRIKKLDIFYFDMRRTDEAVLNGLPTLFPYVADFAIAGSYLRFTQHIQFSSSFPSLKSLSMYTSMFTMPARSSRVPIDPKNLLLLETLRLQMTNPEEVLEWLLHTCSFPHLKTFEIGLYGYSDKLNTFLATHKTTLEHLCIIVRVATPSGKISIYYKLHISTLREFLDSNSGFIDLNSLHRIRTLDFRHHNVDVVSDALKSITDAPHLNWIRFHCSVRDFEYDKQQAWSRIAEVLEKVPFSQPSLLDLKIPFRSYGEDGVQIVRQCLSGRTVPHAVRISDLDRWSPPEPHPIRQDYPDLVFRLTR